MASRSRLTAAVYLVGLCWLTFFWNLGRYGLFDFNEGLYVQAAREMYVRGDWVTPTVDGDPFFDKPPLALWLAVGSFHLFGVTEWAARMPVAVAASLLCLLVFWFGARHFGRRAGLLAATVLALSPLIYGTARQMTMDIHQSLWFAVAMICFFEGYASPTRRARLWFAGFWLGCAFALLSKSVPGLFPILLVLAFIVLDGRREPGVIGRGVRSLFSLPGVALFLAVSAPWYFAAYRAHGAVFWQDHFWHHHMGLLTGSDFDHVRPIWYYAPALAAGMFPWSLFLPFTLGTAWRGMRATREGRVLLFLLVWAVGLVALFTGMTSKLVSYLLPMYPAASLLIGRWLDRATSGAEQGRAFRLAAALQAAVAVLVLGGAALWASGKLSSSSEAASRDYPAELLMWGLTTFGVVALGMLCAWSAARCHAPRVCVLAYTLTAMAVVLLGVLQGLPVLDATANGPLHAAVRTLAAEMAPGDPVAILCQGQSRPSALFYLPVPARASRTGIYPRTRDAAVAANLLLGNPRARAVVEQRSVPELARLAGPLHVYFMQRNWVVLGTRPAKSAHLPLPGNAHYAVSGRHQMLR